MDLATKGISKMTNLRNLVDTFIKMERFSKDSFSKVKPADKASTM